MRKMFALAALAATVAMPVALPTAAFAQDGNGGYNNGGYNQGQGGYGQGQGGYGQRQGGYDQRQGGYDQGYNDRNWHGDRDGNWDPSRSYQDGRYRDRRLSANDRVYRGSDGRYYCKRSNGTTGLVLGGVGGGLIGNALGGGTLGTLLGAGGGALLGKSLDQNHDRQQNRNNGYRCR